MEKGGVEGEEISGESRRRSEQEGKEFAISTHLLEAKHQVMLWRNRDEKGVPSNTAPPAPYTQMLPKGLSLPACQSGKEEKSWKAHI